MAMSEGGSPTVLADELIAAFVRLAKGDFSVRLARNFERDTQDTLAFFVNLIAEEMEHLLSERERSLAELESRVAELSELFLGLAAGDFTVRAHRTGQGDPLDVLAYLFNNTVAEVGDAFSELGRRREILDGILESMLDGVLLLDASGTVLQVNRALCDLVERPHEQLVGAPLADVLDPSETELAEGLLELVAQGPLRDRSVTFQTGDTESVTVTVNASGQRASDGSLSGAVLVARDDRALRMTQAQLQLADRMATMGTLAAGVAHEINNPLSFVLGNLEFIDEELAEPEPLDQDRREELVAAVKASVEGARRVQRIVRDLKTFSRSSDETVEMVDINALVDSALGMIHNELRHHARVVKHLGDVPAVLANEGRLAQVLLNLLQNAAHAIEVGNVEHNEIRIATATTDAGEIVIEVRDTGSGITAKNLRRIFDAFYTTKAPGQGTGLGLSISHKIVTAYGGRIDVDSKPGVGSTFRVVLPRGPNVAGATGSDHRPESARAGGARVLVVDDELEIGEMVRRTLGRDHQVHVVARGEEALRAIARQEFDLILCDVLMPEMSGMELYDRLRRDRPELVPRIVFMTGGAFSTQAREFLARVPNEKMDKPLDRDALREHAAAAAKARQSR